MADNCLVGCIGNYDKNGIKLPLDTNVLMPWVEVWVSTDAGQRIAVGNNSSKNNKAVVKSFQLGLSKGSGVNIEIVDEESGSFTKFFQKITRGNVTSGTTSYVLQFRWGWALQPCPGGVGNTFGQVAGCPLPNNEMGQVSGTHTMVIRSVIANVANGMFKFSIEGTDLTIDMFNTRDNSTQGSDKEPIPLLTAVTNLLKKYNITNVQFLKLNPDCTTSPIVWKNDFGDGDSTSEGPKGVWPAKNRSPIYAARDWMNLVVTDKSKGVIAYWDTSESSGGKPTLVFLESPRPTCEQVFDSTSFNLGTYIVNGGTCSPVISFNPQVSFDYGMVYANTGGYGGGAVAAGAFRMNNANTTSAGPQGGPEPCLANETPNLNNAGIQKTGVAIASAISAWASNAMVYANRNLMVHLHANQNASPIMAELRIQGDPSFNSPLFCIGHFLSIVYINPFYISQDGNGNCVWLNTGPCNNVLSNSNWMIDGLFHEIREGSYTTTIKLRLPSPGIDIPNSAPLGASANGFAFPN